MRPAASSAWSAWLPLAQRPVDEELTLGAFLEPAAAVDLAGAGR